MVSNTNEEKDVWFPFGERNDPKLRRSFNRGVRYAGHPRASSSSSSNFTKTTTTDVSINPEIQQKCSNSNSENEKPNNIIVATIPVPAAVQNQIKAIQSKMEEINKPKIMDKNENASSPKPFPHQIERSLSTSTSTTTTDFDNYCQTPTSKCFCNCRSSSSANTQNDGSTENYMSSSSSMSQPSQSLNNNFSSIYVPTPPLYNSNNCTSPFQQHWPFPPIYWPQSPFNIPPSSPASSFASSNSLTNPSTPPPLLVYQLVPIDMVSGLPAIIPQAGSPQFVYATSINGQPVPVSIHQPEREQRRDSKISLPPIFNFSQPFTTPASPTTSETTSSLSWNSEQEKHDMITSTVMTNNENSWKMQEEMPNLHLSQCFETKKQKNHCLEPLKLKEVPKQKINYEHEKMEEKQQLPPRTPSPIDKRPIRPSPGGRYQIPDLPGEDLYHAVPIKEKEAAKKEKNNNNNNNNIDDSPKKRSPSDLGLFSSVEIRSPLRRRSDMLPPRPPTRNTSMTKLASQLSPKATTPPADLRRTSKQPILPSSDSSNSINTDSSTQESPRTFFTRNKQYRSFNVKTTNVGVNPAVEHLKMLKQKLLDHQQVIKNRGVFHPREV